MTSPSRSLFPLFARSARTALHSANFINVQAASLSVLPPSHLHPTLQHRSFTSDHHHHHSTEPTDSAGNPLFEFLYPSYHHSLFYVDAFIESTWTLEDMAKATKGGYYAVQKGRQPGIYNTWAECEAATKGFAGAVFKKFPTKQEAETFVRGNGYGPASSSASSSSSSSSVASSSKPGVLGKRKPSPPSSHTIGPSTYKRPQIFPSSSSGPKTIVYCDGSSLSNGKYSARAGYGVYFPSSTLSHLSESRRLPGVQQTNNRAELTAIIRAIQLCPNDGSQLIVFSDSKYAMSCVNEWIHKWKKNGWQTQMGKDVENKDLIVRLDEEMENRRPRPKLEYVKAHAGNEGNAVVDKMAKLGASMCETDVDLTIRTEQTTKREGEGREDGVRKVDFDGFTIDVRVRPTRDASY